MARAPPAPDRAAALAQAWQAQVWDPLEASAPQLEASLALGLMEDLVDQVNLVSAVPPSVLSDQQDLYQAEWEVALELGLLVLAPVEAWASDLLVHQEARLVDLDTLAQLADFHTVASLG